MKKIRLKSQKDTLIQELQKEIKEFDENVEWTQEERVKLKFELKMAEMKILELFREYLEIEVYEEQDIALLDELISQREVLKEWNEKKTVNATKIKKLEKNETQAKYELEQISEQFKERVFPNEPEKNEFILNYYRQHFKGGEQEAGEGGGD